MITRTRSGALIAAATLFFFVSSQAADDISVAKDLTSVIALLGLPCEKVVSVTKKGDNDNIATCKDGNRYRVFLNPEGRVVAEKQ